FCFTGASSRYKRSELKDIVIRFGGKCTNNVAKFLDYLVIGAEGNPCWAYACYGRKVEAAVKLRKEGHKLLLVHENDFHDAIADYVGG
ncbi:MAG: NAD-dependent DNA ligase, partial [Deltaproteobacteria bacterium]